MTGAAAVLSLVLLKWSAGLLGGAAWTQSWSVVKRGHFRIVAWSSLGLAVLALIAGRAAADQVAGGLGAQPAVVVAVVVTASLYLAVQWSRTDVPGVVVGTAGAVLGAVALALAAGHVGGWNQGLASVELVAGAALMGAVTNGLLLGHWYLNQPGLKPWALRRLTIAGLAAAGAVATLGLVAVGRLSRASTEGAILGIEGFGESFGVFFFVVWLATVAFTGVVVWAAKRCIDIRSIQSATGLYYVALLTAGVADFLVTYLMLNAE